MGSTIAVIAGYEGLYVWEDGNWKVISKPVQGGKMDDMLFMDFADISHVTFYNREWASEEESKFYCSVSFKNRSVQEIFGVAAKQFFDDYRAYKKAESVHSYVL